MPVWILLLLAFPFVCALIGYVTNVLAVKMIFRPHHKRRILGVSIQGVLPKHQRHFARLLARIVVREFMTTRDLVRALNKPSTLDQLETMARPTVLRMVETLRSHMKPEQQTLLTPEMVATTVDQMMGQIRQRSPEIVDAFAAHADEALNLKDVVTDKVVQLGPEGLERIIYDVSKRELDFIEYYGGIFGLLLGLFQYAVLYLVGNIALPIVGALVGTVTNWLAIQMLFYPREPTRYLGLITYQGLFPKRQREMATRMGAIAAKELIIPEEIFGELLDILVPKQLTDAHVEALEATGREHMPGLMQLLDNFVDEESRPALRTQIANELTLLLPSVREQLVAGATARIDLKSILEKRLADLQSSEFEQLIRGLFQREEIYLIIYGGLLGGLIGVVQLLLVMWLGGV
jgi:uncharacterized membrane protein YheB (UPF0754 family)